MTDQELETAMGEHERGRMEGMESFDMECIEKACGFANGKGAKS